MALFVYTLISGSVEIVPLPTLGFSTDTVYALPAIEPGLSKNV